MKGRYKAQPPVVSEFETGLSSLPIDKPIAVYYRQSTTAQVGNVSTYIQTIDIPSLLRTKGWKDEQIILIDADEGVSGQTKIDEREGMKRLFSLIMDKAIGAVACQDEDRLFRDITQIQVNIFIDACKQSRVLVLTPTMVYDFAHPALGTHHARQFRFKSEMAADYITTVIKGKLHAAKTRLRNEGRWVGGTIPLGYIVDTRKTINGLPNPMWKKLVEFEPYSRIVNEWFNIFVQLNGNIRRTQITIKQRNLYPDKSIAIPDGFYFRKSKCDIPSTAALAYTLMNIAYIGHWAVSGQIIIRDNHKAIVPIDTFMTAYNHICQHDFEGNENKNYKPFTEHGRPQKETERSEQRPLLSGMIYTSYDGDWATVGTHWDAAWQKYRYYFHSYHGVRTYEWSKSASEVDARVSEIVLGRLSRTFEDTTWQESMRDTLDKARDDKHKTQQQLATLNNVMSGYKSNLRYLKTPELIAEVERDYTEAKTERDRLQRQLDEWIDEEQRTQAILDLRQTFTTAIEQWNQMGRDGKRTILAAVVEWVEAHWDGRQLTLTIHFRDDSTDTFAIRKINGAGPVWFAEDDAELVQLVRGGADQVDIMQRFSTRTWCAIMERVRTLMPNETRPRYKRTIDRLMTYEQYIAQCQELASSESQSRSAAPPAH